jgi:tetrahydromethanopterin S-methyltransferase subunit G
MDELKSKHQAAAAEYRKAQCRIEHIQELIESAEAELASGAAVKIQRISRGWRD